MATLPVTFWPADPETDPLLREAAAALHELFDSVARRSPITP